MKYIIYVHLNMWAVASQMGHLSKFSEDIVWFDEEEIWQEISKVRLAKSALNFDIA